LFEFREGFSLSFSRDTPRFLVDEIFCNLAVGKIRIQKNNVTQINPTKLHKNSIFPPSTRKTTPNCVIKIENQSLIQQ
jgi:hypothetical protein